MSGLLDGKQLIDRSVSAEKLADTYLSVEGGIINGDLSVSGNTNLSEKATYKGSEIATQSNLYDDTQLKELIDELEEQKAGRDEIITITNGEGNQYLADDAHYKSVVGNLQIAISDQILSKDIAGLKANLSVTAEGNEIKILGKDDAQGIPVVIGKFNVLQSQLIERTEIVNGHLFITFIVDNEGTPGTETIDIDLSEFIDTYVGSTYMDVNGKTVSLNYTALGNSLIGEGFAKQSDIPQIPAQLPNPQPLTFTGTTSAVYNGSEAVTVNIPSSPDLSGYVPVARTVWGKPLTANVTGDISGTGNIMPAATNLYDIGSSTVRYKDIYARSAGFSGTVTATGGLVGNATTATTAAKVSNELMFTGAVSGIYDGSAPVSVEVPDRVYITIDSVYGTGGAGDTALLSGVERAYMNGLPLYVLSRSEKSAFPVISGINKIATGYTFVIIKEIEYGGKTHISYIEVRTNGSYYIKEHIIQAINDPWYGSESLISDSLFDTATDPFDLILCEATDLQYENTEHETGTVKVAGGTDGKIYQFTVFNHSENELTLSLPSGEEYITNGIEKISIVAGHMCKITVRYIFDKYFIRTV